MCEKKRCEFEMNQPTSVIRVVAVRARSVAPGERGRDESQPGAAANKCRDVDGSPRCLVRVRGQDT